MIYKVQLFWHSYQLFFGHIKFSLKEHKEEKFTSRWRLFCRSVPPEFLRSFFFKIILTSCQNVIFALHYLTVEHMEYSLFFANHRKTHMLNICQWASFEVRFSLQYQLMIDRKIFIKGWQMFCKVVSFGLQAISAETAVGTFLRFCFKYFAWIFSDCSFANN